MSAEGLERSEDPNRYGDPDEVAAEMETERRAELHYSGVSEWENESPEGWSHEWEPGDEIPGGAL